MGEWWCPGETPPKPKERVREITTGDPDTDPVYLAGKEDGKRIAQWANGRSPKSALATLASVLLALIYAAEMGGEQPKDALAAVRRKLENEGLRLRYLNGGEAE